MAVAVLEIGGRRYEMACRDGEQAHLETLAALIDAKARQASHGVGGGLTETRQMLLAALLLADDLHDVRSGGAPASPGIAPLIEALAVRLESLAGRLEKIESAS